MSLDTETPTGTNGSEGSVSISPDSSGHSESGSLSSSLSEKIEAAYGRAESGQDTDSTTTGDQPDSDGQAATSQNENSDSPQAGAEGSQADTNGEASGDSSGNNDSPSEQPLTAPESWPEERKTAFNELDQKGQETLLAIEKELVKGLHKSQEKLARERDALKNNFGAEPEAIKELVEMATTFESDPVSVFTQLAEQAGVDIYFTPQGEEQIPQFESVEEQTRWLEKRAEEKARQAAADKAREDARARGLEERKQDIQNQFAQAHQAHPDLADHRDQVVSLMVEHQIPVESAYRLATYEGLHALADQASGYKSELDKAKAEIESLKKAATVPPLGSSGAEQVRPEQKQAKGLPSKVEAAFERANRKRANG